MDRRQQANIKISDSKIGQIVLTFSYRLRHKEQGTSTETTHDDEVQGNTKNRTILIMLFLRLTSVASTIGVPA